MKKITEARKKEIEDAADRILSESDFGQFEYIFFEPDGREENEVIEDDGNLFLTVGNFRLCQCFDQDSGVSEEASVQRKFLKEAKAFFAKHGKELQELVK